MTTHEHVTERPLSDAPAASAGPTMPNVQSIVVDGVTRYFAYLDTDASTPDPVPLVLASHGGGGNMAIMANALELNPPATPRPYLTLFVQGYNPIAGTGAPPDGVFNSGQAYIPYQGDLQDDVAFVDALLIEAAGWAAGHGRRIDQSRTYAIGFSNGGMMVHRLAAERSHEFAAVAVMQASVGGDPDPSDPSLPFHVNNPADHGAEPVSVLQLHGLIDPNLSLTDGHLRPGSANPRRDLPVHDAVDVWVANNNCDPHPTVESHSRGLLWTWADGDAGSEVKLLTMPAVGHEVPDGIMDVIEPFLLDHSR